MTSTTTTAGTGWPAAAYHSTRSYMPFSRVRGVVDCQQQPAQCTINSMETISCNVGDSGTPERQALEQILGRPLLASQRLVIGVVEATPPAAAGEESAAQVSNGEPTLPEWCDVYAGLSDQEVADLEQVILKRADFSRYSE